MKDKNILISGGCGFIGSHIVDRLIEDGNTVYVVDNLCHGDLKNVKCVHDPRSFTTDKFHFYKTDIRDYEELERIFEHFQIDCICHQAALISVPASFNNPQEYHDVNVNGTLNLLNLAVKYKVKKVVIASSCAVYGDIGTYGTNSEYSIFPLGSPYALNKRIGEEYAELYSGHFGLKVVCLRYFNVYGERQRIDGGEGAVIPTFINKLLKNSVSDPIQIYGDGQATRDFIHVKDVVNANIRALESRNFSGIVNVGTGHETSIRGLLARLEGIVGVDLPIQYRNEREGDIKTSVADLSLIKSQLGWKPETVLDEGLLNMVNYYKRLK